MMKNFDAIQGYQAYIVSVGEFLPCSAVLRDLSRAQPLHVAFLGASAEAWHDGFEVLLDDESECLTTFSVDEPISDLVFEAVNIHLPMMVDEVGPVAVIKMEPTGGFDVERVHG